jgi:hypothetical protein
MPVALFVRRVGETLIPVNPEARDSLLTLPEGRLMRASVSKPRSKKQHGRVFAAIDEAFRHWPSGHELEPHDTNHLRAWLLCKIGHVEKPFFDVLVPDRADPATIAMQVVHHINLAHRRGKWAFARQGIGKIRIFIPETINWEDIDQPTFAPIAQAIFEEIENTLGTTIEKLFEARSERARTAAEVAAEDIAA